MRTVDRLIVRAPADPMFDAAADVERWPERLAHYRWVRFNERRPGGGIVEMAAVRPFGPLAWPIWWESEMWIDPPGARSATGTSAASPPAWTSSGAWSPADRRRPK